MVNGLASAREQLQWQLIYADKSLHFDVHGFADCSYLLGQRSVPSLRTKTTKTYATTSAQSVGID